MRTAMDIDNPTGPTILKRSRLRASRRRWTTSTTGYSCSSHLHRLPIDELKLDMSFIHDLEHGEAANPDQFDPAHWPKPRQARGGRSCGNPWPAQVLAGPGCEVLQGFLFCRPLPAPAHWSNGLKTGSHEQADDAG
jgi:predicted signal transduction protein with EAL and GGDEF domain